MNYSSLHFNCVLSPDKNAPHHFNVRYLQIGFQDKDGFTGWVQDYAGAGEYESFYVIKGQAIGVNELGDDFDGDQEESYFEDKCPGLSEIIFKKFEELVTTSESNGTVAFYPNQPLVNLIPPNYQKMQILSDTEGLIPFNGFHTNF